MRVVTPTQMREIDKKAIDDYGIPGIVLMENATLQTLHFIEKNYVSAISFTILAGNGNNGGDGLALARLLFTKGKSCKVLVFGSLDSMSSDAKINFTAAEKLGISIFCISNNQEKIEIAAFLRNAISSADVVIDALFGTGLSKPLEGHFKTAVEVLYSLKSEKPCKLKVLSLDIPSGINGENGQIMGCAVFADDTVTFGYPKLGHLLYPGKQHTGKLHIAPISLPPCIAKNSEVTAFTLEETEASGLLKKRLPWGHKGTFGKAAVIAGSTGMTGAACLTANAALKSGAGTVTAAVPESLNHIFEIKLTEVMTHPLKDTGRGVFSKNCIADLQAILQDKDALAIGPGIGREDDTYDILEYIFTNLGIPIVLDADGLYHIAKNQTLLKNYKAPIVITPHPGEMARLMGLTADKISLNPIETALDFAKKANVTVALKGATSIVVNPKGDVYINKTGNCGMATAGSGDVLTGLIAGLLAQNYEAFDAAVLGTFIHGLAGDEAALEKSQDSMTAVDILEKVPFAIKKLRFLQ